MPTYNGAGRLPKLLESIERQSFSSYNCYVIDDASSDNTAEVISERFPWVNLIRRQTNCGPSANRNIAIDRGTSPYIVIFDDDTYLKDTDWLANAVSFMDKNPQVGQLATMIVDGFSPDILLDCGIHRCGPLFGGLFHRVKMSDTRNKHLEQRRVLGACTAGSVVRRDVLNVVGKFDESYYYPCEDIDLSLRIHLAGYDVIYEPSFVVYHYETQAMGKRQELKNYLYRRNCLLVLWENYPLTHAATISISLFRKIFFKCLTFRKYKNVSAEFDSTTEARHYMKIFFYLILNSLKITVKRLRINRFRSRQRKYLLEVN